MIYTQLRPLPCAASRLTSVAAAEKVLAGGAKPGFQTPSLAFGADFILEIAGSEREDVTVSAEASR